MRLYFLLRIDRKDGIDGMIFNVYIYKGKDLSNSYRNYIFSKAVSHYTKQHGLPFKDPLIKYAAKGKPYLSESNVKFNISHSDDYWVCIIGNKECGIDVQKYKSSNYKRIVSRFFSERDMEYVEAKGITGFFELWAMREAFAKYTGEGFFGKMPEFVGENQSLLEEVRRKNPKTGEFESAFIRKIEIHQDVECMYCTGGKDDDIRIFIKR